MGSGRVHGGLREDRFPGGLFLQGCRHGPAPAGQFAGINYAFLSYEGPADKAEMMLTALEPDAVKTWGARLEGLLYTGSFGEFSAALNSMTRLPGVADFAQGC